MKKILYLSDVPLNSVGGAQESMKVIMNELKDEFSFFIITPTSKKEFENQIIFEEYENFVLKGKSKKQIFKLLKKIKKEINKINPDIIHVQMPSTMILIGLLRSLKLISKKIEIFYTDRGVLDKYGKITRKCIKYFSKNFKFIITTTDYNGSLYKKLGYVSNNTKLVTIPNTAGDKFDVYLQEERNKVRNKFNIDEEEIVIGFSGRQSVDKNWPLAIEIIRKLNENYKFKVCIALGTNKTAENIEEAKCTIDSIKNIIGADRTIDFIDVSLDKMNELYYLNDIFILSSKVESFGRTAVEAMSRKNVVYGTRVDGLKEVIGYEENRYSSVAELEDKIKINLEDKAIMNKEKEKFYQRYHLNYKTNICIGKYNELYKV